MTDNGQKNLFDDFDEMQAWKEHWQDMPEFIQDDLTPEESIIIHFKSREDRIEFSKLIGQTVTYKTQSLWFPKAEIERYINKRYTDES